MTAPVVTHWMVWYVRPWHGMGANLGRPAFRKGQILFNHLNAQGAFRVRPF